MALGGIILYIQQNVNEQQGSVVPVPDIRTKTAKLFQPRRGMRFTDDPSSTRPVASYIGTAAVTRTRPTTSKTTMQLHTVDSIKVYGQVQFSGVGPSGVIYGVQSVPGTGSGPPPVTLQSITISPSPAVTG